MRRFPKAYGEYKTDWCPYCGKKAIHKNQFSRLNVCKDHAATKEEPVLRGTDGEFLQTRCGPYGNYCVSIRRGNIPLKQVFEMNDIRFDESKE